MMIAAAALLWGAVLWRVVLTMLRGWAGWRGMITVATFCLAVTLTGIVWRGPVDDFLGVANLGGLVARVAVILAILTGHWTLIPTSRRARVWMGSEAAAAAVVLVFAWVMAPLHDYEVLDLRPLSAASIPVAVYTVGIDVHLCVAGVLLAIGWIRVSRRSFRDGDKIAAVTLGTGAAAVVAGVVASGLLLLQVLYELRHSVLPVWLGTTAVNGVIGLTGALAATALFFFPIGEWLVAQQQLRKVTPGWQSAIAEHPGIYLPLGWWARIWRPQLVLHRRRLELEDAASQ